ncbi:MAG: 3'-5' exonuclease domain-containing protein 2 [Bacteroidales bacterium]|nr:3'-5' exonuclease domain-containing protein 2 [Bacteroidales bacterium]
MSFAERIAAQELENLETASFEGPITVVSEPGEDLAEAVEYLSAQKILGFDTETKPCFQANAPRNRMAILQLSGKEKAYVFKLQVLGLPAAIAEIMSNPTIVKVGAAVRDDVRGLQHYHKFIPRNFLDLQKFTDAFGIRDNSVKKMAAIILDQKVSKSQQLSNWEAPQLSGAQLKYAATDAWICVEMYERLMEVGEAGMRPLPLPHDPNMGPDEPQPVGETLTLAQAIQRATLSGDVNAKAPKPKKKLSAEARTKRNRKRNLRRKRKKLENQK